MSLALLPHDLSLCIDAGWSPALGQVHPGRWLTAALMFGASALAGQVARRAGAVAAEAPGPSPRFWQVAALVFALLALDELSDLQNGVQAFGRCLSELDGWYVVRRPLQGAAVAAVSIALAALAWRTRKRLRDAGRGEALAIAGLAFSVGLVLVRAFSFHWVDQVLSAQVAGLRLNWVLEGGGLVLFAAGAAIVLRRVPGPAARGFRGPEPSVPLPVEASPAAPPAGGEPRGPRPR